MSRQLGILLVVMAIILAGAYWAMQRVVKPDFVDSGEPELCQRELQFTDFPPDDVHTGPVSPVRFDTNDLARKMEEEILSATPSGINFNGRYIVADAACGLGCHTHAIVDAVSGNIVHLGLQETTGLVYTKASSLIVVNQDNRNPARYYQLRGGQLHYLCESSD